MRGRVMALYMAVFMGGTPIGAPIIGWIGEHVGARYTIVLGGVVALATAAAVLVWLAVHEGVRIRYRDGLVVDHGARLARAPVGDTIAHESIERDDLETVEASGRTRSPAVGRST